MSPDLAANDGVVLLQESEPRLVTQPLDSSDFESWGSRGRGQWMTVYANSGHAYLVVAGLRFDTSGSGESGPRWRTTLASTSGYVARHPAGL